MLEEQEQMSANGVKKHSKGKENDFPGLTGRYFFWFYATTTKMHFILLFQKPRLDILSLF